MPKVARYAFALVIALPFAAPTAHAQGWLDKANKKAKEKIDPPTRRACSATSA